MARRTEGNISYENALALVRRHLGELFGSTPRPSPVQALLTVFSGRKEASGATVFAAAGVVSLV